MYANGNKYNGEWLDGRCCSHTHTHTHTSTTASGSRAGAEQVLVSAAYIHTQKKKNTNGNIYNGQWGRGCTPGAEEVNFTY